jgi:hypothetical protein
MRLIVLLLLSAGCTPMPKLHFNEPPTAPAVHIDPASPYTTDLLSVTIDDDAVDAEGDDTEYTYTWTVDGVPYGASTRIIDPSATTKGEVWEVTVSASDGEFAGETVTSSVTILNSLPTLDSLTLSPAAPTTEDDLLLDPDGTDADGEPVVWEIAWTRDGEAQPSLADLTTIPASATGSQEEWTATVTPFDGTDRGEPQSASVYVDNTAPTVGSVSLLPNSPTVTDAIQATVHDLVDPDGQTVSVTFTWFVNGVSVGDDVSTTGVAYLSGAFAKGDDVSVTAIPNDGFASGNAVTSTATTVVNTPPVLDEVTLSPTSGYEGTTFTCTPGSATDDDADRVDYDYAWYVGGTLVAGATSDTLTGSSFRKGDEVYCVVTPTDDEESGSAVTSDTADVLNTVPVITTVSLSPAAPTVASSISSTVTGASDADGDSISYTYSWTVNGVHTGGSTSQLANTSFERDDEVELTVTPSDGAAGTAVSSGTVTVVNALPSVSSVNISPSNPYNDDNLTCQVSGWYDADGDTASYTYQWYRSGLALTGQTGVLLAASHTTRGDRFSCTATPYDGYDIGTVRTSGSITILNSPPDTVADALSGLTAEECDTIQLDATGSTDEDGDTLTYNWSLATKPTASLQATADIDATTDAQPTFLVDAAGTFLFQVSASDGSTSVSDTVGVTVYDRADNNVPVGVAGDDQTVTGYGSCSLNGTAWVCSPCTGTTFTVDAGSSYDDDGDPLHYAWSTSSGYATIASPTSESTTVRMVNLPASHGVTTTYTASMRLRVVDCAEDTSEDYVTLTFECIGT